MIHRIIETAKNAAATLIEAAKDPEQFVVPAPDAERKRRETICNDCSVRSGNFCSTEKVHPLTGLPGCGCYLPVKHGLLHQHCPSEMW